MAFLDRICSALGHKLKNTLVIEQSGDFYEDYEVDYAKYCARCGKVEPQPRLKTVENKA